MKHSYKKGFTLSEVLIATIVMSMIMGSVLAFVQYSSQIWYRGNEKISAQNYNRMTFELIKQELLSASKVDIPSEVGRKASKLIYYINGTRYTILLDSDTNDENKTTLVRIQGSNNSQRMRLARNVASFKVKRISNKTFEITLQIKKEQTEEEIEEGSEIELVTNETMVLLAPGLE